MEILHSLLSCDSLASFLEQGPMKILLTQRVSLQNILGTDFMTNLNIIGAE
jgi:hypothetical protein